MTSQSPSVYCVSQIWNSFLNIAEYFSHLSLSQLGSKLFFPLTRWRVNQLGHRAGCISMYQVTYTMNKNYIYFKTEFVKTKLCIFILSLSSSLSLSISLKYFSLKSLSIYIHILTLSFKSVCFTACEEGYHGSGCDKHCSYPYYGLNCALKCKCIHKHCHYQNSCINSKGGILMPNDSDENNTDGGHDIAIDESKSQEQNIIIRRKFSI